MCVCAGGLGVPALSVEDRAGMRGYCVHGGSPAAAVLLVARVGRQEHLHAHLAEGRTHPAAPDHGREEGGHVRMTMKMMSVISPKVLCDGRTSSSSGSGPEFT